MSDLKKNISSNNTETFIKSFSLRMGGADLKIDHQPRRKNKSPHRRALVHDFNDGLTINWTKDYPGGVTINGKVKCPDYFEVAGQNILDTIKKMQNKILELERKIEDLSWNNGV